jgi:hypothetical protein
MVLSPAPCPSASSLSLLLLWRLLCLVRLLQALSLPPEQEAREHGVLLLLGGQEKEVVDEVQIEEDGDVEL